MLCIRAMTPCTINGDAEKFSIEALELWKHFIVKSHLISTDRTPICRVKGQNDRMPAKAFKRNFPIGAIGKCEFRRRRARLQRTFGRSAFHLLNLCTHYLVLLLVLSTSLIIHLPPHRRRRALLLVLGHLSYNCLRCKQQARDRSRLLQRSAGNLGWVNDAGFHHDLILPGLSVKAVIGTWLWLHSFSYDSS